jgi:hypothetical protein
MMKTGKRFIGMWGLLVLLALALSACQVNIKTDIDKSGAGTYIQEIGFQGDEASLSGLSVGDEDFCAMQADSLPPNTRISQETRNGDETWCVYESKFDSLEALRSIYGMTDTQIDALEIEDGIVRYDVTLDLQGEEDAPMGADLFWQLTLPGTIMAHNADEVKGNTLTWKLRVGELNTIQASSQVEGTSLDFGDTTSIIYVVGGLVAIACCCIVPIIVIGGVIFLLVRRKKVQANPADTVGMVGER